MATVNASPFLSLPEELIDIIVSEIPLEDQQNLGQTSREMHRICAGDPRWKELCADRRVVVNHGDNPRQRFLQLASQYIQKVHSVYLKGEPKPERESIIKLLGYADQIVNCEFDPDLMDQAFKEGDQFFLKHEQSFFRQIGKVKKWVRKSLSIVRLVEFGASLKEILDKVATFKKGENTLCRSGSTGMVTALQMIAYAAFTCDRHGLLEELLEERSIYAEDFFHHVPIALCNLSQEIVAVLPNAVFEENRVEMSIRRHRCCSKSINSAHGLEAIYHVNGGKFPEEMLNYINPSSEVLSRMYELDPSLEIKKLKNMFRYRSDMEFFRSILKIIPREQHIEVVTELMELDKVDILEGIWDELECDDRDQLPLRPYFGIEDLFLFQRKSRPWILRLNSEKGVRVSLLELVRSSCVTLVVPPGLWYSYVVPRVQCLLGLTSEAPLEETILFDQDM